MTAARIALGLIGSLLASGVAGQSSAAGVAGERLHRYTVTIDRALEAMEVNACFDGVPPSRLSARSSRAADYILAPELVSKARSGRLQVSGRSLRVGNAAPGSCVSYRVDLNRAVADSSGRRPAARRYGTDLTTTPDIWLWRASGLADGEDIRIRFVLPDGVDVSAPWERADATGHEPVFQVGRTPANFTSIVAFGRFQVEHVEVPGARLRLAVLNGRPAPDLAGFSAWIDEAASAVATLYGAFPLPAPQILVVPQGRGSEAVPWAQVTRGGGAAAHFFVDQRRPMREFHDDWTAAHELSHMLLPYMGNENAWLSEGTASYYQNVLRARAGMITAEQAWSKLEAGFGRGRRDDERGSLRDVSRNMRRNGAFMRVYWSGAAFALLADIRLRQLTGGEQSLDTALRGLRECCLPAERQWSAREVLETMDGVTGTTVFTDLHRAHLDAHRFPDLTTAYRELGLVFDGSRVRYADDAPDVAIREAIMQVPAAASADAVGAGR